jgi:hypothetical protein
MDGMNFESTIGDHSSLSEYGYPESANIASCEYDRCSRSRNGTEPVRPRQLPQNAHERSALTQGKT